MFPAIFAENCWVVLASLLKIISPYVRVYFCALCSIPLVYLSVFMLVPHCFDYHSFVVCVEIRMCETSSSFVFLLQDCFGFSSSPKILHDYKMKFSISAETLLGFQSDQIRSVAQLCPTLCDPMNRSTPGLPVHHQLLEILKLTSIESVMPSNHLILCCSPLLQPPSIFPALGSFPMSQFFA